MLVSVVSNGIIGLLLASLLIGCGSADPDCGSEEAKDLVIQIVKENNRGPKALKFDAVFDTKQMQATWGRVKADIDKYQGDYKKIESDEEYKADSKEKMR